MSKWIKYTGSDEQIAEILAAPYGFIIKYDQPQAPSFRDEVIRYDIGCLDKQYMRPSHYLICNPHPLADMIIRQAQTGQPVWTKVYINSDFGLDVFCTNTPDWNLPNAEYSFAPFEDNSGLPDVTITEGTAVNVVMVLESSNQQRVNGNERNY